MPMALMTVSLRKKSLHIQVLVLTLLWFAALSSTAAAVFPSANKFPEKNSGPFAAVQQPEFLPVDEAYKQDFLFTEDGASAIFQIASDYYLYREKLAIYQVYKGDKTALPLTLRAGEVIWDDYFNKETEVYRQQLEVPLPLGAAAGVNAPVRLEVHYQGCADAGLCYPPQVRSFEIDVATGKSVPIESATVVANRAQANGTNLNTTGLNLSLALLLAFAGGLLLNFMPCVFPVLSIKLLAISQNATNTTERQLHGWLYSAGVVVTFVAVAALMLALRAGGEAVGWGFQLQSPVLVAALVYLFVVMGLSLSGLTEFGTRLMGIGSNLGHGGKFSGSFSSGVLATIVASPCTAPLMGSALGFAVTQPTLLALVIFAALGAGMAAPFLLLTYVPKLAECLPRPGPWMERFKQLLAFPMYLTAVWLLWVLGRQSGGDGVALVLCGVVAIAFALWLWPRSSWQWGKGALALVVILGAVALLPRLPAMGTTMSAPLASSGYWQRYSPELLESGRNAGRPVLVNMTAAWCVTCLANEKLVLSSEGVSALIKELKVLPLKGDWTNQDPQISALLNHYGRTSVPLYLLYPSDGGEAVILPQILTREGVLSALRAAALPGQSFNKELTFN